MTRAAQIVAAIIVAAGRGTRAGGDLPKQWQILAGRPVVAHAIDAFRCHAQRLVLVIHPEDRPRAAALGADVLLVEGGETRDQSVRNALEALAGDGITHVLIHDGARPLVPEAVIARVLAALETHPGAAPALRGHRCAVARGGGVGGGHAGPQRLVAGADARRVFTLRRSSRRIAPIRGRQRMTSRWRAPQGLTLPSSRAMRPI